MASWMGGRRKERSLFKAVRKGDNDDDGDEDEREQEEEEGEGRQLGLPQSS